MKNGILINIPLISEGKQIFPFFHCLWYSDKIQTIATLCLTHIMVLIFLNLPLFNNWWLHIKIQRRTCKFGHYWVIIP